MADLSFGTAELQPGLVQSGANAAIVIWRAGGGSSRPGGAQEPGHPRRAVAGA